MKKKILWTVILCALYVSFCWCIVAIGQIIERYLGEVGLLIVAVILFCMVVWYLAGHIKITFTPKDGGDPHER